jgi:hypothetical protein
MQFGADFRATTVRCDNLICDDATINSAKIDGVTVKRRENACLEYISGTCDGRTVYPEFLGDVGLVLPAVTAVQQLNTGVWQPIDGCSILYQPPTLEPDANGRVRGTVVYQVDVIQGMGGAPRDLGSICTYGFELAGVIVQPKCNMVVGCDVFYGAKAVTRLVVNIDSDYPADDPANCKLQSWTTPKLFRALAWEYTASNEARLHQPSYYKSLFQDPQLPIIPPVITIATYGPSA